MNAPETFVPAAEAAFIGDISTPQINRLVDDGLVPRILLAQEAGTRRFARLAAAFAQFFFATEPLLATGARKRILAEITDRVSHLQSKEQVEDVLSLRRMPRTMNWKVVDAGLGVSVDVGAFVRTAMARAKDVDKSRQLVVCDPGILGGLPCFSGTQLPIENVLASLDTGISETRVLNAFPGLTTAHLAAARIYQQVHPRRGRPRRIADPNAHIVRKGSRPPPARCHSNS